MNEDRLRGPIPAFELLSIGFAAAAPVILGKSRDPATEGIKACWKPSEDGPLLQVMLAIWDVTCSWFHTSDDAEEVRAAAGLYFLLQGRPGEELSSACGRLLGVIERWGADVVRARHTIPGGYKYYEVRPNETLAWVVRESGVEHGPRIQRFADQVADKVRDLRRVVVSQKEVSESWHQQRIVA